MRKILLIGSGWRAETWTKIILKLPGSELCGVLCRNKEKSEIFRSLGANTVTSYEEGLSLGANIALVCVSKNENLKVVKEVVLLFPVVLTETPTGATEEEIKEFSTLKSVRVLEQYPLQPRFVALKNLINSGCIGDVRSVSLSACHEYHAVAVLRALLNERNIDAVSSMKLQDEYVVYAGRRGKIPPEEKKCDRLLSLFKFGEKTGFYDFSKEQYFSDIRSSKVIIQGTKGEIINGVGRKFDGENVIPFSVESVYNGMGGNLYPVELSRIVGDGKVLYENKYLGLNFSEEEIAMADILEKNTDGKNAYFVEDACVDAFWTLKMNE